MKRLAAISGKLTILRSVQHDQNNHGAGNHYMMTGAPTRIPVSCGALDEVLLEGHFYDRKSVSTLEIAEHLLAQAAAGERDQEVLKSSALAKLLGNAIPDQAA